MVNVHILFTNFTYGYYTGYDKKYYTGTLATGLILILSKTNINLLITNVIMEGNTNNNGKGGNLFIHFYHSTSNNVTIVDSKFLNGTAWLGGGIGVTFFASDAQLFFTECKNILGLYDTEISHNTGIVGSGLYFESETSEQNSHSCPYANMTVLNCTFDGNQIKTQLNIPTGNGVAVHLHYKSNMVKNIDHRHTIHFLASTFKNSKLTIHENKNVFFRKVAMKALTLMTVNTDIFFTNCTIMNNKLSGIGGYNAKVIMNGDIMIKNNTGLNGGGVFFCESSYMILSNNTKLSIIHNHAIQSGGGIFIEGSCLSTKVFCFYQLDSNRKWKCSEVSKTVSVEMINNTAGYAGDHIYGGDLDNCMINDCHSSELFESLFFNQTEIRSDPSAVTSDPRKICFCNEGRPDCSYRSKTFFYRGKVSWGDYQC